MNFNIHDEFFISQPIEGHYLREMENRKFINDIYWDQRELSNILFFLLDQWLHDVINEKYSN